MSNVANSLNDIFRKHRLVFWYDPDGEMQEEYSAYEGNDIEKLEVDNNEFALKHHLTRSEPDKRFLLYIPYSRSAHTENWLLDLELGHHLFHADGISVILQEMGWQEEHRDFVQAYSDFFNNKDRRERLGIQCHKDDDENQWKLKMLGVITRTEGNLESCLYALLAELAENKDNKWSLIEKFSLDKFFWESIAHIYDYQSEIPTVLDFLIEMFIAASPCGRTPKLGREAKLFLGRWKDSTRHRDVFKTISKQLENDLNINSFLNDVEGYTALLSQDAFEAIERKIIIELRNALFASQLTAEKLRSVIEDRERSFWYDNYRYLYTALITACSLNELIKRLDIDFSSFVDAIEYYTKTYYEIDQKYRHYCYAASQSGEATLLAEVNKDVERRYSNDFLLRLNDRFQQLFHEQVQWPPESVSYQRRFYNNHVSPFLKKGIKLFVIISDALRYEVAEELDRRILQEDRFRSRIDAQIGVIPSFTQLGMASLLPHKKLGLTVEAEASCDDTKASGLEGRKAILASDRYKSTAVKADDFLKMNTKDEGRALFRDHDLVYIYQNGIDHTGDKRETESHVFTAVEKELDTLIALIKKVAAVNGNNILITSDHGFIYQNTQLDESEFTENPIAIDKGTLNRRFALAKDFESNYGSLVLSAEQLGLEGDFKCSLPKSINRYRVKGAGSRYVHGGASLQELVIPVLTVNKARKSDTETVQIDIIRGTSNLITTSQVAVSFYQEKPVVEKQLGRTLRVSFYSKSGDSISDVQEITFDSTDSDPRQRERKTSFIFSKAADNFNNQDVFLRLDEKISGTNQYKNYKEYTYRFRKAFETDFEF